ncbi:MAG: cobalt ECF transporter T component CbiQ [Chloroflexota bacterium]|nr:cobalt ECF transporter T component CbiQ [Chloroflexota bacterium]
MELALDAYADLDSPLHRWEPRMRLVGLVGLIFAFAFVQHLWLLPVMAASALTLYGAAQFPLSFLWKRLRSPGFFLLMMAFMLPFLSGSTVMLHIGPLALRREGSLDTVLIVTKFVSIMTVGLILFGTAPFLTTIEAMRALGLPPVLADMTLFSYRYIYEIGGDLATMRTAMGLRGFRDHRLSGRSLGVLASLAGSILVRSYEQSERVYKAMILRGYGQSSRPPDHDHVQFYDWLLLGFVLLVAGGLIAGEVLLRRSGG